MRKNYLLGLCTLMILLSGCKRSTQYDSFDQYPSYRGKDLELVYSHRRSLFRFWAPTAHEVTLRIYNQGEGGEAIQKHSMRKGDRGTWRMKIKGDLKGKYYTFQIRIDSTTYAETPGSWATAVGINGQRAAIIDMNATHPEGWQQDKRPSLSQFTDMVIYEVHMRDFSIDSSSGMNHKGQFLAFTEVGSQSPQGLSTGIDHLKELGVTHVHIMPSFDFASIDERFPENNAYNWGYDPQNFNVPEGSYSSNAYDPSTRIREFKAMVLALHQNGIRVIMDVVYNHTFDAGRSPFQLSVPNYFYRHTEDGQLSNGSGCGNEVASERLMARRYIVRSVLHWIKEYHIDGFRFDLMGLHDLETMNLLRKAVDRIDPSIFLYGEGWTAGDSPLAAKDRALKINAIHLNRIAVFSDDIRDALKGSWADANIGGFVSGVKGLDESLKFGIVGAGTHPQIDMNKVAYSPYAYALSPEQVINYVSCHDDLCLFDKLRLSAPKGSTTEDIIRFNKLAQTAVFTAQGVPFIYAGEELLRDKKGIHNTYRSPDSINAIDWTRKATYANVFNYYKELIALRKAHPAFRLNSNEKVVANLKFMSDTPNLVVFTLNGQAVGDTWKEIIVVLNGNPTSHDIQLPKNHTWKLAAHDGEIKASGLNMSTQNSYQVAPYSAGILFR